MRPTAWLITLFGCAAAWTGCDRGHGADAATNPGAKSGPPGGGRVIPVIAGTVARRDVPIYLEGLGTVVASKTVTVRPQVDGRLEKVLFKEGQAVKRGDVLAQIDPRPFQIQLRQ